MWVVISLNFDGLGWIAGSFIASDVTQHRIHIALDVFYPRLVFFTPNWVKCHRTLVLRTSDSEMHETLDVNSSYKVAISCNNVKNQ